MYLRLLILFCFQQMAGYAQTHGIDSMRNRLPILQGNAKVDCLNKISEHFSYKWIHADSALRYSHLAIQQASAINYQRRLADALMHEADINGRLLGKPLQMVSISRRAIEIAKSSSDKRTLGYAFKCLAGALALAGDYHHAADTALLAKQIALETKDKKLLGWSAETIGFAHVKSGAYWKGFEHFIEAHQIGKELNDSMLM